MKTIFERTAQGATLGGILGGAFTALGVGAATLFAAPLTLPALAIGAAATAASTTATGILIGGGVGAASGTVETIRNHRRG